MMSNDVAGLAALLKTTNVELSKKLITNAAKLALRSDDNVPSNPEVYALKPDSAKQGDYAASAVLLLSADCEKSKLCKVLEKYDLPISITEMIIETLENNRIALTEKHLNIGYSLPHVNDIEWRIACNFKSILQLDDQECFFSINLGNYKQNSETKKCITSFVCNVEELQCLVNKLKEIEIYYENIGNPSKGI